VSSKSFIYVPKSFGPPFSGSRQTGQLTAAREWRNFSGSRQVEQPRRRRRSFGCRHIFDQLFWLAILLFFLADVIHLLIVLLRVLRRETEHGSALQNADPVTISCRINVLR
jgi:hypothetical protein